MPLANASQHGFKRIALLTSERCRRRRRMPHLIRFATWTGRCSFTPPHRSRALERQGDPAPDICKRLSRLTDQNIIMIGRRCNAQPRRLQSPQAIVPHLLFRPALTPGTPLARLCPKVSVPAANESSGSGRWQGSDCTGTNPGRGRFPPKAGPYSTSGGLRHMLSAANT